MGKINDRQNIKLKHTVIFLQNCSSPILFVYFLLTLDTYSEGNMRILLLFKMALYKSMKEILFYDRQTQNENVKTFVKHIPKTHDTFTRWVIQFTTQDLPFFVYHFPTRFCPESLFHKCPYQPDRIRSFQDNYPWNNLLMLWSLDIFFASSKYLQGHSAVESRSWPQTSWLKALFKSIVTIEKIASVHDHVLVPGNWDHVVSAYCCFYSNLVSTLLSLKLFFNSCNALFWNHNMMK